jgi:hypothetical protein
VQGQVQGKQIQTQSMASEGAGELGGHLRDLVPLARVGAPDVHGAVLGAAQHVLPPPPIPNARPVNARRCEQRAELRCKSCES